jgi:anaerobic selenocysteine-containing dehydrogenase
MPEFLTFGAFDLHRYDLIPEKVRDRRIGVEEKVLPNYFSALPQKLVKAMLSSNPYPVRAAFIQGGNILQTYSNVEKFYQALNSLDFMAATDLFLTPTAEMADVVLPVRLIWKLTISAPA